MEAGPDRGDVPPIVNRDRDAIAAGFEGRLERTDHLEIGDEAVESPLGLERGEDPGEVAAGRLEGRALDLDLVQADHGIDDEVTDRDALANDLAMDLALGRHIDEDVAVDRGAAAEATIRGKPAESVEFRFVGPGRREMRAGRGDAVLRKLALTRSDLAAATQPAPAAHRIEVHAE